MKELMLRAEPALAALARTCLWLAGIGLVAMTVMIAWQVFGRFVLNDTPTWTESVSVIVMSWMIFLGAAVGVREGFHLSFDILLHVLPDRARSGLHTVSDLVVMAFGVGMAGYGGQLAATTWGTPLPNVGWPTGVTYLAVVVGGVLIVLFAVERVLRRAFGLVTRRFGDADETQAEVV